MLGDPQIQAVVIATPVKTHFELAVKALEAGKHILVEKPIATTVGEVDRIGELAREKNLVVMVGHTFLYNAAVRYVKKIIDAGELGDIRYIYSQRLNLGRIRSDVDALWNFAPHDISIIQYWLGDPEPISVVKRGVDYIQERVDDVVFMNILYPNKVMANIHVSWLDPRRLRQMTVVGSKKMVVYDNDADNKVAIYDKGIDRKAVLGQNMDYDNPRVAELQPSRGRCHPSPNRVPGTDPGRGRTLCRLRRKRRPLPQWDRSRPQGRPYPDCMNARTTARPSPNNLSEVPMSEPANVYKCRIRDVAFGPASPLWSL